MPENSSRSEPPAPGAAFPDRFARCVDLYGAEGFARIRAARVAVIGLGGVGSHAAMSLARTGVGKLLLADFDQVTASSLNRSPVAGPADVGRAKVEVLAEDLAHTCPDTQIEACETFCHEETLATLLDPAPHCVVDAIDSLNPKLTLLTWCARRGLPVFSSMGAAARRGVGGFEVADIATTRTCPLAARSARSLSGAGSRRGSPASTRPSRPWPPCRPTWTIVSVTVAGSATGCPAR